MKIIMGLGNPTKRYSKSRHNIGFMVIDELSHIYNISINEKICRSMCGRGMIDHQEIILAKPQTYMNLSGDAVSLLFRRFSVPPENLVVIHDDLDLTVGRLKIKTSGGTAGHRGVTSIIRAIGNRFVRIRIGIGRPDTGRSPEDYVLDSFEPHEIEIISGMVKCALDAVRSIIIDGVSIAMNRFNRQELTKVSR
ncbi:MAG: aminoacyl-tRNA hydrolase [Nitrospirota bacterium]